MKRTWKFVLSTGLMLGMAAPTFSNTAFAQHNSYGGNRYGNNYGGSNYDRGYQNTRPYNDQYDRSRYGDDDRHRHHSGGIGAGKGALIGAGGGALIGGLLGGGMKGALIGGGVGAAGGALIGNANAKSKHHHDYRDRY